MKKQLKPILISLVFILTACLVFSGCGKSAKEKNPDLATVTRNTLEGVFGDWLEAGQTLNSVLLAEDGTRNPCSLRFQTELSHNELGSVDDLTLRFGLDEDNQGNSRVIAFLELARGGSLTLNYAEDQGKASLSLQSKEYQQPARTVRLRFSPDRLAEDLRASDWNPEKNPDSVLTSSAFAGICEAAEKLFAGGQENGSLLANLESVRQGIRTKLSELSDVTWTPVEKSKDYRMSLSLTPEDFLALGAYLDALSEKNTFLRLLTDGESSLSVVGSEETPFMGFVTGEQELPFAAYPSSFREIFSGAMAATVTATVSDNRFTSMHAVLTDDKNQGPSAITLDADFAYGSSHSACTLRAHLPADEQTGASDVTVTYTADTEDGARVFRLSMGTAQEEADVDVSLLLRYEKETGDFTLIPTVQYSGAVANTANADAEQPDVPTSSAITLAGSVLKEENAVTVNVRRIQYTATEQVYNPASGLEVRYVERDVHPKCKLVLQATDALAPNHITADFDLGSATAEQMQSLAGALERLLQAPNLLSAGVLPDYSDVPVSLEGFLCEPRDLFEKQMAPYANAYEKYLLGSGSDYPYVYVKDETLKCNVLMLPNAVPGAYFVYPALMVPDFFHPATYNAEEKCLEVHDWVFRSKVDATCEEQGGDLYVCSFCGKLQRGYVGDYAPHHIIQYGDGYTDLTGKSVAYTGKYCDLCGGEGTVTMPDYTLNYVKKPQTGALFVHAVALKGKTVKELFVPSALSLKQPLPVCTDTYGFRNITAETIRLQDGFAAIEAYSFSGSTVQTLVLPASLTYVDVTAFADAPQLKKILYAGSEESWKQKLTKNGVPLTDFTGVLPNVEIVYNYSVK